MTKWIKLQSSVGSRAAEKTRQEGGGEEVEEMERERQKGGTRGRVDKNVCLAD